MYGPVVPMQTLPYGNTLPVSSDVQTAPASSTGPDVNTKSSGHSISKDSFPRHRTFSTHWTSSVLPENGGFKMKVAPRRASSAPGKPSCLQATWASVSCQVNLSIAPHFPAKSTSTRPAYGTCAPFRRIWRSEREKLYFMTFYIVSIIRNPSIVKNKFRRSQRPMKEVLIFISNKSRE